MSSLVRPSPALLGPVATALLLAACSAGADSKPTETAGSDTAVDTSSDTSTESGDTTTESEPDTRDTQVDTGPDTTGESGVDTSETGDTGTVDAFPVSPGPWAQIGLGASLACGLGTSGHIACWGDWLDRSASPPASTFTELSVGYLYGCATNVDGNVSCWGYFRGEEGSPPAGPLHGLSAGDWQACALSDEGTSPVGATPRMQSRCPRRALTSSLVLGIAWLALCPLTGRSCAGVTLRMELTRSVRGSTLLRGLIMSAPSTLRER